jgi:hypothetical protein
MDPEWGRKLSRFAAVSVRDCNSWHLVRGGIDREAELVLDPCLLFPEVAKGAAARNGSPYALVYGHGFPVWLKDLARSWADRTGTRLVSVGYSNGWADEQRISASPGEFAQLMSGARAVVTNFFHGCVFALLNGKPWATVPSNYRSIKIPDLAAMLDAEHRLVEENTSERRFAELLDTPLVPQEAKRVSDYRARSEEYLDEALR